ncbi:MAG: class I SAM-dependent methyltransferase [Pseudomonadota bacterium]
MTKSIERFTDTVQDYVKYRPSYPNAVLDLLIAECGLNKDKVIADVGSGTGLLSQLFLNYGNTVYGVEPNQAMREVGEVYLRRYSNFHSVAGTAEATHLPDKSVDFVTVGTAFHWFDPEKTKQEFYRIAQANAWVLLVWNVRNIEDSALVRDYEDLIRKYGKDYSTSNAIKMDKVALEEFFKPHSMRTASFDNSQQFDWEGLKGRLLSTSYSLRSQDSGYEAMLAALKVIFERYQQNGRVTFLYKTKLYYSPI